MEKVTPKYIYEPSKKLLYFSKCDLVTKFNNFSGVEKERNRKGDRNFCLYIDDLELVKILIEDGWNVKEDTYGREDLPPRYFIAIKINLDYTPSPEFTIVDVDKKTIHRLTSTTSINALDSTDIAWASGKIYCRHNEASSKYAIKGYLLRLCIARNTDYLDDEFADYHFKDETNDIYEEGENIYVGE